MSCQASWLKCSTRLVRSSAQAVAALPFLRDRSRLHINVSDRLGCPKFFSTASSCRVGPIPGSRPSASIRRYIPVIPVPVHASSRPVRVAVIGAGPAGLACTRQLLKLKTFLKVDLYESSLVPLGLLRLGVAPDHGDVKNIGKELLNFVTDHIEKQEKDKNLPQFSYFGGVKITGNDLSRLEKTYDAVIVSTGWNDDPSPSESSGFVPEVSAQAFVRWYNGSALIPPKTRSVHASPASNQSPARSNFSNPIEDLFDNGNPRNAVVIVGQGNVAVDVARILISNPFSFPSHAVAPRALEILKASYCKEDQASRLMRTVEILGRKSAFHSPWSIAPLRELFSLSTSVRPLVYPQELQASVDQYSMGKIKQSRPQSRMLSLLQQGVENYHRAFKNGASIGSTYPLTNLWFRFFVSIDDSDTSSASDSTVRLRRTWGGDVLSRGVNCDRPSLRAPHLEVSGVRLVVKSTGFVGKEWRGGSSLSGFSRPCCVVAVGWQFTKGKGNIATIFDQARKVAHMVQGIISERASANGNASDHSPVFLPENGLVEARGNLISAVQWQDAMALLRHEILSGEKLDDWVQAKAVLDSKG